MARMQQAPQPIPNLTASNDNEPHSALCKVTLRKRGPANDNAPAGLCKVTSVVTAAGEQDRRPRIRTDLPERLLVIKAEVDLIEAFFPDLIAAIIANDN